MPDTTLYRYRAHYSKEPELRFISHLDLMRTWERTLRRAQIPVAYTEGFHPHQRINLGAALPLGFSSKCELIDIWLQEELQSEDLLTKIVKSLPPGIRLHTVEKVKLGAASLQKAVRWAEYLVKLQTQASAHDLKTAIEGLLSQDSIRRERRGKVYDLRPLIDNLHLSAENGTPTLTMRLSAVENGTGRPDEVVKALGFEPERSQIERTRLILVDD
jgi:radical SAM-linked protein